MKEIKITNGSVILKDFCSRKLKKEINRALFGDNTVKIGAEGKSEIDGMTMSSLERANDVALIGMTEKIIIDGQELAPTVELYDSLNEVDVVNVLAEVNAITSPSSPNN